MFEYIDAFTAVFLIALSMFLSTRNFTSAAVFKIIPFFLGVAHMIEALKAFQII